MDNAPAIRAKVVVEGANGPTTPDAHQHLHERGVFVVPDILANSAGVTTSYFEWVQDRYGYFWTEKEVNERLEAKMCEAFNAVLQTVAEVQGRHAHRRLHRRHQPRRHRHAHARHVRVISRLGAGLKACAAPIPKTLQACPHGGPEGPHYTCDVLIRDAEVKGVLRLTGRTCGRDLDGILA